MDKNILINFPTNIGDAIMALPSVDLIKNSYPASFITAIVSPATKDILATNNFIDEIIFYDKKFTRREKIKFIFSLVNKYEIILDFKNSLLPVLLGCKKRTAFFRNFPKNLHIKEKYLRLTRKAINKAADFSKKSEFTPDNSTIDKFNNLKITASVFIAVSSRSSIKQYPYNLLKRLIEAITKKYAVVIIGEAADANFYKDILFMKNVTSLVGKTSIVELPYLIKNFAKVLLGVDSAIMHLACYLDIAVVGLFGPTPLARSYPWSKNSIGLISGQCPKMPCDIATVDCGHNCMEIEPDKIIEAIDELLRDT